MKTKNPPKELKRNGSFSSSAISALCSKGRGNISIENVGKPFATYVEEKAFERALNRPLNSESNARPLMWGKLVESVCFDKLGLEYSLVSKTRYAHSVYGDYWNGMPDLLTEEIVGDIKCPWTMKSFCKIVKAMKSGHEALKEENPVYYWQLVSNAILCGKDKAMLIVYVPFQEDLEEIREEARKEVDGRYAFINWSEDDELPYLVKGGKYNDVNVMEFEVPAEDKAFLEARVVMAINELEKEIKNI